MEREDAQFKSLDDIQRIVSQVWDRCAQNLKPMSQRAWVIKYTGVLHTLLPSTKSMN